MTQPMNDQKEEKALAKITNYMEAPIVVARFKGMMGEQGAKTYINSILLSVAEQPALQKCTPVSIYTQALRAATLRLSVDPGIGQAYLVPFGARATLIVGYKGLHDMAVRTGKYRYINVGPVYEGEVVEEDRLTGLHSHPCAVGPIDKNRIIGWLGAFEMTNGYAKTLYMTHDEIHEHAKQYSKGYDYKDKDGNYTSLWHKEPTKMERKTVLRLLLRRWGYMDPADVKVVDEIEEDVPATIDAEFNTLAEELENRSPEEQRSEAQNLHDLGFNPDPIDSNTWDQYLALCNEAEKFDVPYSRPNRDTTTKSDLLTEMTDLRRFVADAKAQAQMVENAPQ